ncbi:MAG: PEGA domain-containing protein [Kofleriaceae bacterium]|nr:PEGA domain-containing protein [Myxococcales bacterium]MCB9570940.1 PEGA domain-containing protein [Kofleriaceae bacterium]
MTPRTLARLVAVIAAATVALAALAPPARAEDDKKAEAEKYFRAGERAYNAGQYLVAAQAFEEAYELLPVPAIAFSTAQAYRLLYVTDKQPAYVKRAVELYRLYVGQQKEGGRVPDAVANLAELEPVLERLQAEGRSTAMPVMAPRTVLMISSQVDGARGEVAGTAGPLPLTVEVPAGEYVVKVEADGYFATQAKATAVDGQFIPVEVDLEAMPAVLDLHTETGARVEVDGRPYGATPLVRPIQVPAGRHFVAVTHRGRVAWSREIDAARGETVRLDADLRATGQRRAVKWVWIGAGALMVAAGGAAGYALSEQGKAENLDDQRLSSSITSAELDQYLTYRDHRDSGVRAMWGLAAAGVVTATVGTLMYFFDRPDAEMPRYDLAPTPAAAPTVSPFAVDGGAGVSVSGGF